MTDEEDQKRAAAIKRLKAKRDFRTHVATYIIVNLLLTAIWALSGAGYYWPIWTLVPWGVGLAFHGWAAYTERPISEEEIRREMSR